MSSIHETAVIAQSAKIHEKAQIGPNVVIHDYVTIHPGVTIDNGCEILQGAIIGRIPRSAGTTARKVQDNFGKVIIGEGTVVSPYSIIYTDVTIGKHCLIGDGASIREGSRIGNSSIIGRYVTINYEAIIGNRSRVMDHSYVSSRAIVGDEVFISMHVCTSSDNEFGSSGYDKSKVVGPVIQDGVSIGAGANILPKTKIGKGSIVGAGAVVTKDVPDNTLVMGVPAKVVREL